MAPKKDSSKMQDKPKVVKDKQETSACKYVYKITVRLKPLTDQHRGTLQERGDDWLQDFESFLKNNDVHSGWFGEPCSEQNVKRVMEKIKLLKSGQGIKKPGKVAWFQRRCKLKLSDDLEALHEKGLEWLKKHDGDPGHGWLLEHPLKKLQVYQRHIVSGCAPPFQTTKLVAEQDVVDVDMPRDHAPQSVSALSALHNRKILAKMKREKRDAQMVLSKVKKEIHAKKDENQRLIEIKQEKDCALRDAKVARQQLLQEKEDASLAHEQILAKARQEKHDAKKALSTAKREIHTKEDENQRLMEGKQETHQRLIKVKQEKECALQDAKTAREELENLVTCIICNERPRSTVVLPCSHFVMCGLCADDCKTRNGRCPMCMKAMDAVVSGVFVNS